MNNSSASSRADLTRFQSIGGRPPPREARLRALTSIAAPAAGEPVRTRDGRTLLLRDIHVDDVEALRRGFADLTPEEVRLRFLHPLTDLPASMARKFCEIDPDLAVALVLVEAAETPEPTIRAVARAYIDPATLSAEFALIVQHAYAGRGLGMLLMRRLLESIRQRGAVEIWGDVLNDNGVMLRLCEHLGFEHHLAAHDPGITRVLLKVA
jgi:acetyltransferase